MKYYVYNSEALTDQSNVIGHGTRCIFSFRHSFGIKNTPLSRPLGPDARQTYQRHSRLWYDIKTRDIV